MRGALNNTKRVKLFWDIDGTLIRTNGAAAIPFRNAVSKHFGFDITLDRKKLSGFTDYEIIEALALDNKFEINDQIFERILEDYSAQLPESLIAGNALQINSVFDVLSEFELILDFENAIATGNCKKGALAKLRHTKLDKFFENDNIFHATTNAKSREEVVFSAKKSLKKDQFGLIIGDSPKDIIAARRNGLKVLAVSTGLHSFNDLEKFSPDHLLKNDYSHEEIVESILKISSFD
jgi:phosphoglycolate phosphatase